jgi:hypothetical protein
VVFHYKTEHPFKIFVVYFPKPGFLFTKYLVVWYNKISVEKPETLTYRRKNLIGKIFFLRVAAIQVMEEI